MKIATFNVQNLLPTITAYRKEQIKDLILQTDADILCLQEVGDYELLIEVTPNYKYRHIGNPDMRGIATAIVSKVPVECSNLVIDFGQMDYFTSSGVGELVKYPGRSFVVGSLTYNDQPLFIVGIHLKASSPMSIRDSDGNKLLLGSHEMVARGRVRTGIQKLIQAHSIRKYLDEVFTIDSAAQVIVLGDFNDYQYSLVNRMIEGDEKFYNGPGILKSVADLIPEVHRFSHIKSNGAKRLIDTILISESVFHKVNRVEVLNSHLTNNSDYDSLPSDHAPLLVEIN